MNKILTIKWQRLVHRGVTCTRCQGTGEEVQKAMETLNARLLPCGIRVSLETEDLDLNTFKADPSQSNRICLAGRPLEFWLEGRVGHSPCCAVCGEEECRTLELDGQSHETIPADLIVQAGLMAAASLISPSGLCGCGGPASCPPGSLG